MQSDHCNSRWNEGETDTRQRVRFVKGIGEKQEVVSSSGESLQDNKKVGLKDWEALEKLMMV